VQKQRPKRIKIQAEKTVNITQAACTPLESLANVPLLVGQEGSLPLIRLIPSDQPLIRILKTNVFLNNFQ